MRTNKSMSMKAVILLLAVVLLFGCAVGGTLAWLTDKSDTVTNTFAATGIEITLLETKLGTTTGETTTANEYPLIPGVEYTKDPVVTVKGTTNVDCWLFLKVEQNNPDNFLQYELDLTGWTKVDVNDALVYSRPVTKSTSDQSWHLLVDDKLTISSDLTADTMDTAKAAKLSFTAYAIQQEGFATAEDAWTEAKKLG